MERKKKETKPDVSLLKPINLNELAVTDENDCFGKMWDPQHRMCSVCSSVDVCGVVFQETQVIPAKKKFDKEVIPLDLTDFQAVEWDKVKLVVAKYEETGDPMTYDELFSYIKGIAKTKDDYTVKMFIEKSLEKSGLRYTDTNQIVVNA